MGGPFSAAVINTGSSTDPYTLSLVSHYTGSIAQMTLSGTSQTITNEVVGNRDGTLGATAGDYSLSTAPWPVSDVSSITVGGTPYTARAVGGETGTGDEVEVNTDTRSSFL